MVLKLSNAAPGGSIPDSKRMCLNSMRMATTRILTTATVLLWLPGASAGQVVSSPYRFLESKQEVAFFVGTSDPNPGQLEIGIGSATVYGGRYSVDVGSTLTMELGTTVFAGNRKVRDPRRARGDRQIGVSDLTVATLEARFRLNLTGHRSWHRLRPFVLVGGGLAFAASDDKTIEDAVELPATDRFSFGNRFTAVAGGGIAIHASPRFTIRLDASLNLWKVTTPPGFTDLSRDFGPLPESEWIGAPAFTVGTAIRF
ncbi:MAG: hypothetical protein BMS9Abin29_0288 [Gemmatimonadota bacterium]|nr:MAG: hypothetical protein BMS9Abin29_0288 [Gemmatimonadota bacterium]